MKLTEKGTVDPRVAARSAQIEVRRLEALVKELIKEGEGRNTRLLEVMTDREELLQLLHHWHWLWNEGELTFEPLQWTQEGFEDLVVQTRVALHKDA